MSNQTKKGHIVVIDDEHLLAKVVAQTLRNQGYQTTTYTDRQKAIDGFKAMLNQGNEQDISVILSDIKMPGKDGLETVQEIVNLYRRYNHKDRTPEIVFISGFCNEDQKKRAKQLSPYEILEKPLSIQSLTDAIKLAQSYFDRKIA